MLDRLREWWNRPDPLVRHIMWQYEYIMEWVDKWCQKNKWSRTWKQAAKKWFDRGEIAEGQVILYEIALEQAKADADRRRELLRQYDEGLQHDPYCFSCGIMIFNEDTERWEHPANCGLGKELADD